MMKKFLIALVKAYQRWLSPLFPPSCRFRPTCSVYMIQAIEKHETGDDPVPDYFSLKRKKTPLDN